VLVEAVLAAIVVDMVVWAAVVTRNIDRGLGAEQIISVLLLPALDAGLVAVAIRVVLVAYDQATGPRALAIGMGAQLAAHLSLAVIALVGWSNPDSAVRLVAVLAIGMSAVGLAHPSMAVIFEPQVTDRVRLSVGHPAIVAGASLVAPGVLFAQALRHDALSPGLAIGSAALALLMVGHLVHLIRRRADVEHRTEHDPLTGLPNRVLFVDRLDQALAQAKRSGGPVGVLFCDVDQFKRVNDSLGHDTGDELLRSVTQRFSELLRPGDTLARFGSDEFGVLVGPIGSVREVTRIAERVAASLTSPFVIAGSEHFVTASTGIAIGDGTESAEALIRDAELAMRRAKERGRGRYELVDELMRERAIDQLRTENDLRRALERDELCVHYQPIVSLGNGVIEGFEALVRWEHPERGLLPPGEFIPMAEESGLIVELGDHVLDLACAQAARWTAAHPQRSITVSVNVSARQLADTAFPDRVHAVLELSELPPASLLLEVTETTLVAEHEVSVDNFARLKSLGVGIVLDDFGTGFSSLGYLRRFPFDQLKIDRSFVDQIAIETNAAIVAGVIGIAEALDLRVVAEGIETEAQLDTIRALGCHRAQGFLFSRAVPAATAGALLRGASVREATSA
jgi:diguanylate cyclase (GGDEF)-like protein